MIVNNILLIVLFVLVLRKLLIFIILCIPLRMLNKKKEKISEASPSEETISQPVLSVQKQKKK